MALQPEAGIPLATRRLTQGAVFAALGKAGVAPLDEWIRAVEKCATTKAKGDHFEALCVAYLLDARGGKMTAAWTLPTLPVELRAELGLPKKDYGIDIIARDAGGRYHAVQAKFKGRSNFRPNRYQLALRVNWTELATFYALAARGPYAAHWVITTADGVTRPGGVGEKDRSVCYRGLKTLPAKFWHELAQMEGRKLGGKDETPDSEDLRARRLARFEPPSEPLDLDDLIETILGEMGGNELGPPKIEEPAGEGTHSRNQQ